MHGHDTSMLQARRTHCDGSQSPKLARGPGMTDTNGADNLRTAYEELCTSYRAIDDFRAKLLGFLPLVTGGGLILLTGRAEEVRKEFFGPVGLFGIIVTTGLLAYELFGI